MVADDLDWKYSEQRFNKISRSFIVSPPSSFKKRVEIRVGKADGLNILKLSIHCR